MPVDFRRRHNHAVERQPQPLIIEFQRNIRMSHCASTNGDRSARFVTYHTIFFLFALLAVLSLPVSTYAQNITLRGNINPSTITDPWKYSDIYGEGNVVVLGSYRDRGVFIFDISDPDHPVLASRYNPGNNQQMLEALVRNNIGYFGSGNGGGVHIVNLANPSNPVFMSKIDSTVCGGTPSICAYNSVHEILLYNNFLIENFNGLTGARLRVIDISNPTSPVFVREFVTNDPTWVHATHIAGNRLFTSGWGGKTDVYDLTNIATSAPVLLGTVNTGTNSHSSWTSSDGNYLYNARELVDGDLRVYNITNLASPTLVKTIKAADLGLNAICPHNPVVMGNLLFVAWYQAGLQVFDISNPANPVRLGQYDTFPGAFNKEEALQRQGDAPWDMVCGLGDLTKTVPSNYDGNWAVFPFLGLDRIILGDLSGGLFIVDVTPLLPSAPRNRIADFDGDGKTDVSQFRPASGTWFIQNSLNNSIDSRAFGLATDVVVPGDYDGDGRSDVAVFRPSDGTWYMLQSTGGFKALQFGTNGDIPVAGYFDSDNKTDAAVFRPSTGTWYAMRSTAGFLARQWGTANDKPFVSDFDGDNLGDIGVYRPSEGTWYILTSSNGAMLAKQFGTSTDMPLIGDFDGDHKTDFSVFRPVEGTWYLVRSSTGAFSAQQFGINGDMPVPGDYDGDNLTDLAVYRPASSYWYILKSATSSFEARQFGESTDVPVPSAYHP